jgi:SAM-dependent methyltransferase
MGYIFDFHDAKRYDQWIVKRKNRFAADLESRLMLGMLDPIAGESVLDIGCGTGASIAPLLEKDLDVTGIDPSPYMLDILSKTVGNHVSLYRGIAEDLPFDDNSFNHACLFTCLEFVDDPKKALAEAFRVAKDRVFIGFLNRYALTGIGRRVQGIFTPTIYNRGQLFQRMGNQKYGPGTDGSGPGVLADRLPVSRPLGNLDEADRRLRPGPALPLRNLRRYGRHPGAPVPYASFGHPIPAQKGRPHRSRCSRLFRHGPIQWF